MAYMKIIEKITHFLELTPEKKHEFFQELWMFDQEIFPTGTIEQLYDYVHDVDAIAIPVVRYYHEGRLVGQNIIPILKVKLHEREIFVVNSRAGFLDEYRRRNLSLNSAIRIVLQHRLKHPTTPMWFVPTIMQPKVYMLFASRSKNFFPRAGAKIPADHLTVLELMTHRHRDIQQRGHGIFTHPCHLPRFSAENLIRLRNKSETHVNYFMKHIPDYFDGYGLMCVCELNFKTILETTINLTTNRRIH
jgi:hypothetical protein